MWRWWKDTVVTAESAGEDKALTATPQKPGDNMTGNFIKVKNDQKTDLQKTR